MTASAATVCCCVLLLCVAAVCLVEKIVHDCFCCYCMRLCAVLCAFHILRPLHPLPQTWCLTQRTGQVTAITSQQKVCDFLEYAMAVKSKSKRAQRAFLEYLREVRLESSAV